jgi:hypothetical protein
MKQVLLYSLILFSKVSSAQSLEVAVKLLDRTLSKDTIYYTGTTPKLAWDDFKGSPREAGYTAALTSSGFGFGAGMHSVGDKGTLNITVYSFFLKNNSWVKADRKTAYILNHEQHHFDISYIGMRNFVQQLKETKFTLGNYAVKLNTIYNECYQAMEQMQNDYDTQTRNGQQKDKQAEWVAKIDGLMNGLK